MTTWTNTSSAKIKPRKFCQWPCTTITKGSTTTYQSVTEIQVGNRRPTNSCLQIVHQECCRRRVTEVSFLFDVGGWGRHFRQMRSFLTFCHTGYFVLCVRRKHLRDTCPKLDKFWKPRRYLWFICAFSFNDSSTSGPNGSKKGKDGKTSSLLPRPAVKDLIHNEKFTGKKFTKVFTSKDHLKEYGTPADFHFVTFCCRGSTTFRFCCWCLFWVPWLFFPTWEVPSMFRTFIMVLFCGHSAKHPTRMLQNGSHWPAWDKEVRLVPNNNNKHTTETIRQRMERRGRRTYLTPLHTSSNLTKATFFCWGRQVLVNIQSAWLQQQVLNKAFVYLSVRLKQKGVSLSNLQVKRCWRRRLPDVWMFHLQSVIVRHWLKLGTWVKISSRWLQNCSKMPTTMWTRLSKVRFVLVLLSRFSSQLNNSKTIPQERFKCKQRSRCMVSGRRMSYKITKTTLWRPVNAPGKAVHEQKF